MDLIIWFILKVLSFYTFIIFIRCILSWVNVDGHNPIVQLIHDITDPVLDKCRFVVKFGVGGRSGIDLAPIIVIFGIQIIERIIIYFFGYGSGFGC